MVEVGYPLIRLPGISAAEAGKAWRALTKDANGKIKHATSPTDPFAGIAQFDFTADDKVQRIVMGITNVKIGESVAAGSYVVAGADGKVVKATRPYKSIVVDGAAADTDIAIADISKATDRILLCTDIGNNGSDFSAQTAITSAGNIRVSVTTANKKLFVAYDSILWNPVGRLLDAGVADDIVSILLAA